MSKCFIELTRELSGDKVLINVDNIVTVYRGSSGSALEVVSNPVNTQSGFCMVIKVKEPYENIFAELAKDCIIRKVNP